MRPRERRDSGQGDLLRSRLDQIIDMRHSLVTLAKNMDWAFIEKTFGEAYTVLSRKTRANQTITFTHNTPNRPVTKIAAGQASGGQTAR